MASPNAAGDDRFDQLYKNLADKKKQWDEEDVEEADDTDRLLDQAIEMAMAQGKGWSKEERDAYLEKILDDDFIPPIFAENVEEVEKSGLAEAFTSLKYDGTPTQLMLDFKKKGNHSFANGKRNEVGNKQYFRDAINHYYEAFAWGQKVEPQRPGDDPPEEPPKNDDPIYTEDELDKLKSTICANAAMAHMQLKNWGFVRDESKKALAFNKDNVKAWYRLAKAHQMLQEWEEAGNAIDSGLSVSSEEQNKDLLKLRDLLASRVQKARKFRQQREKARALRMSRVKEVWKHCKERKIQLGRVPLVSSVTDDEDGADDESRWHHHRPHSGNLPQGTGAGWVWPCMFLYPSHRQSDFVKEMSESEMLAVYMAEMFPELENDEQETAMSWDYNNEFACSKLAVYFEVHCSDDEDQLVHPENVERLTDQGVAMRFYESSRALMGDEGADMANIAKAVERKHLHKQRKRWTKKHGSLWAKPKPCPVVRVHPAVTLGAVLTDARMIVPNFLVTFILFPEDHPAHHQFLKEHNCLGLLEP